MGNIAHCVVWRYMGYDTMGYDTIPYHDDMIPHNVHRYVVSCRHVMVTYRQRSSLVSSPLSSLADDNVFNVTQHMEDMMNRQRYYNPTTATVDGRNTVLYVVTKVHKDVIELKSRDQWIRVKRETPTSTYSYVEKESVIGVPARIEPRRGDRVYVSYNVKPGDVFMCTKDVFEHHVIEDYMKPGF